MLAIGLAGLLAACAGQPAAQPAAPTSPAGAAAAPTTSTCVLAAGAPAANTQVDKSKLVKQINLYTWDGYFDQGVLDDFKKEFGVEVKVETYDANETMYNKFKAGGNPGYDLIVPSDYMVERMAREGMLEKIDFTNIPNAKYMDPGHAKLYFDPTGEYAVAHNWGTTGIAFDSDKVKEDMVKSWKNIFAPADALSRKIGMLDDPREPIAAALRDLGFDGSTTNLDELAKAKDLLLQQKSKIASYKASSDYKKDLVSGDVQVAMMYSNDAILASKDKPSIKYIIPEGNTTIWQDNICIPKGGKSKYTAEVFIDYMLRPDVAAKNTNALGLSSANTGVIQQGLIDKVLLDNKNLYPDDVAGKVKNGTLQWLIHFSDAKVTAAYDKVYNEVLAK